MALPGSQLKTLQDALLDAFDQSALQQMVRIGLNENLAAIAGGANLKEITFNLIGWAERNGRVEDLLAAAWEANPSNPALLALKSGHHPDAAPASQINAATQQYNVAGDVYQIGQVTGTTIIIGGSTHADRSAGDKTAGAPTS